MAPASTVRTDRTVVARRGGSSGSRHYEPRVSNDNSRPVDEVGHGKSRRLAVFSGWCEATAIDARHWDFCLPHSMASNATAAGRDREDRRQHQAQGASESASAFARPERRIAFVIDLRRAIRRSCASIRPIERLIRIWSSGAANGAARTSNVELQVRGELEPAVSMLRSVRELPACRRRRQLKSEHDAAERLRDGGEVRHWRQAPWPRCGRSAASLRIVAELEW